MFVDDSPIYTTWKYLSDGGPARLVAVNINVRLLENVNSDAPLPAMPVGRPAGRPSAGGSPSARRSSG